MNGTPTLPPGWAPDTDVAAVIAEMEKRVERLQELDKFEPPNRATRERKLLHSLIAQLIKTGHS